MPLIFQKPTSDKIVFDDLKEHYSGGLVYACDFYVDGAEKGLSVPGGYKTDWLVNIDHHAATERMRKKISSTTLAIDHVKKFGPASSKDVIIINHADCDSILSSRIMSGDIEPLDIFNEAAIAADHTGAENEIADLLQALDSDGFKNHEVSFNSMLQFLNGGMKNLDQNIQKALDNRLQKRRCACELVAGNIFSDIGRLTYAVLTEKTDGELFLPFLKKAYVIMTASPHTDGNDTWIIKVRLGNCAPKGLSLKDIDFSMFDQKYSGRWNAGSNNRGGGTPVSPDEYAQKLSVAINAQLSLLELK
jgi:hypothetical protein